MHAIEHYSNFTAAELLDDDFFIQWVINPGEETNLFWQSFVRAYPRKQEAVDKAASIIKTYRTQDVFDNEANKAAVLERISDSVKNPYRIGKPVRLYLKRMYRVAAIVIVLAGAGLLLKKLANSSDKEIIVSSKFGEVKTIRLADNSEITLNGNSSVSYRDNWNDSSAPREVWIKGEAYFNVKHLNKDTTHIRTNERFIVHSDDVTIEVLGTTFNVKSRHGKTNVTLISGRIKVDYAATRQTMIMAPGDYVEYGSKKLLVNKKLLRPARVSTWTNDEIDFTDASLREIAETLQDNYGYNVTVPDTSLLSLKLEGDISVKNITDLFDVVSTALNVKIEQLPQKTVRISK
jgi:ferric-dicitrate binding protein FerR (iron transport regulator)